MNKEISLFSLQGAAVCLFAAFMAWVMFEAFKPNIFIAETRAKVSRTKADMRSTALALEMYHVHHGAYPPSRQVHALTTPVAYLNRLFSDIFAAEPEKPFAYFSIPAREGHEDGWILISSGPDGITQLTPALVRKHYRPNDPDSVEELKQFAYDPFKATMSGGDVYRVRDFDSPTTAPLHSLK